MSENTGAAWIPLAVSFIGVTGTLIAAFFSGVNASNRLTEQLNSNQAHLETQIQASEEEVELQIQSSEKQLKLQLDANQKHLQQQLEAGHCSDALNILLNPDSPEAMRTYAGNTFVTFCPVDDLSEDLLAAIIGGQATVTVHENSITGAQSVNIVPSDLADFAFAPQLVDIEMLIPDMNSVFSEP